MKWSAPFIGFPVEQYFVYEILFKNKKKLTLRAWRLLKDKEEIQDQFDDHIEGYNLIDSPPIDPRYWSIERLRLERKLDR